MQVISNTSLHLSGSSTEGYQVEIRSYARDVATPLVVEHYGPLSRDELDQVVEAAVYTLRPGVGYFGSGDGYQVELPGV